MEPRDSLPWLQEPSTCSYPDPDQASKSPHPHSFNINLILTSNLRLGLSSGIPSLQISHQNVSCITPLPHNFYISRPFILFDLNTRMTFGRKYKSRSFSLCNFHKLPATLPLIVKNLQPVFLTQCVKPSFPPVQNNRQKYVYVNFKFNFFPQD